jgi:preprotein translocase subunit SecA
MRLAGMSGTVREVRRELWQVYGLRVIPIPPHKPRQHRVIPDLVFSSGEFRWNAVASVVARLQKKGVPVLVGTRSVRASEEASRVLAAHGIAHDVLNAKRVEAEADIIAEAGQSGRVTVVTNMAGRGTDIELGEGVAERGGLHVVMCERSDAGRIDRQLAGRAARQGQPGVFFSLLSLDDQLMQECPIPLLRETAALSVRFRLNRLSALCCRAAQWSAELRHARIRRDLLESEQGLDDALAFAGTPE